MGGRQLYQNAMGTNMQQQRQPQMQMQQPQMQMQPAAPPARSGPRAPPGGIGKNNLWCPCGKGYKPYNTMPNESPQCDFCKTPIMPRTTCFRCRLCGLQGFACVRYKDQ